MLLKLSAKLNTAPAALNNFLLNIAQVIVKRNCITTSYFYRILYDQNHMMTIFWKNRLKSTLSSETANLTKFAHMMNKLG